jgi:hypothetical protein
MREIDDRAEVVSLLNSLKTNLPKLEELFKEANSEWGYEDPIYRLYHQSFKVFYLQSLTKRIIEALTELSPLTLNQAFTQIVTFGTNKSFDSKTTNANWLRETRPIIEAFFHARYFLEMGIKYGKELKNPPCMLPSGWAALLYLYNLR